MVQENIHAKRIDAPKFEDLKELARHALRRRKELLNELQIINVTLRMISTKANIKIDLDKNKVVEK